MIAEQILFVKQTNSLTQSFPTMPSQILAKSPNRPQQSRRVYDYLKQQPRANQKYTPPMAGPEHSPYSKEPTEYELVVEFELRREKEKTMILEERLRNKESFIKQMKEFQDELTLAFQKCQEELHYYKAQCDSYESRSLSFPTFNDAITPNIPTQPHPENDGLIDSGHEQLVREYVEEIAELKHLIIRLEEEINFYEKKTKTNNSMYYSSKNLNSKQRQSLQHKKQLALSPIPKKQTHSKPKHKQERSKTLANQFLDQKRTQNFTSEKLISQFINDQQRKISSFINHFLTMASFFEHSIEKEPSIGQKLKKAWKWIKKTIVEWKNIKKDKLQNIREFQIGQLVTNLLPVSNLSMPQVQKLMQKMIKSPSQNATKRQ